MAKLKSFEELFQKKLGGEKGLINSGEKFLGVFLKDTLKKLEELLRTDLGSYQGRNKRPFICKFEQKDNVYVIIFLTTKTYSKKRVELKFCNIGRKDICRNLEYECFVLRDRNRNDVLAYAVSKDRFENFTFEFCGTCKNLEHLDSLRREFFR